MDSIPKILLVDDKIENIIALEMLFSELNIDFVRATSGNEALKKTLKHDFALTLMDVQMPGMDGYETVELMRQEKKTEDLSVIFISAIYSEDYYQIKGIEAGAVDFITKPVNSQILLGKIRTHLDLYKRRAELKDSYDRLEQIVCERTAELSASNEQLSIQIAERKLAEEERARLNVKLSQKNKELEQIVYVTSHDLRTPLVNIDGFTKIIGKSLDKVSSILDSDGVSAEVKEEIASIVEKDIPEAEKFISSSIAKMESLLSGLLQISRVGKLTQKKVKIDMNKMISVIRDTSKFQIDKAGVNLEVTELPSCKGDETQINQVVSNLIDNALKYLDPARPGVIKISGHKENSSSVYCVEDNGIGIKPEHLGKIFDIFHQLNPKEYKGEGLGLSIVGKILDRHNGKVWVESEVGKGSKFFVSLPRA